MGVPVVLENFSPFLLLHRWNWEHQEDLTGLYYRNVSPSSFPLDTDDYRALLLLLHCSSSTSSNSAIILFSSHYHPSPTVLTIILFVSTPDGGTFASQYFFERGSTIIRARTMRGRRRNHEA